MTDEIVGALSSYAQVTKVPVNPSKNYDSGLDRAKSLSANFRRDGGPIPTPHFSRRRQDFRRCFGDRVELAVALAWPGIENSWIGEFVQMARQSGARTVVLVVDHPSYGQGAIPFARELTDSGLVLVGDIMSATVLSANLGTKRPVIEVHRALSLTGRGTGGERKRLTTFLPKDDEQSLASVLRAFDAIPVNWINEYSMRIIMRYSGRAVPDHVATSYHADHVELI
jgi:hypothetical protein